MNPPIFQLAIASSAVTDLLGVSPTRFWSFGEAPREETGVTTKPYAVWQLVGGSPENNLSERPQCDAYTVQVDIYAKSASATRAITAALRDAVELDAHIVSWHGEEFETDTGLFRNGFTADFYTDR